MSDNLVNRLRWAATLGDLTTTSARNLMEEAADRIAELEAALRNIEADCCSDCPPSHGAIKYACRDALEGAYTSLYSAKHFILEKYGATNPAREEALKQAEAVLAKWAAAQ